MIRRALRPLIVGLADRSVQIRSDQISVVLPAVGPERIALESVAGISRVVRGGVADDREGRLSPRGRLQPKGAIDESGGLVMFTLFDGFIPKPEDASRGLAVLRVDTARSDPR